VAAVPTETFYGLAADPTSAAGVERVRALKGRDGSKPLLVLFASRAQLAPLGVSAGADALDRYFAIWPAPLTVVLPIARPIPASLGALSLGVRMPAHAGRSRRRRPARRRRKDARRRALDTPRRDRLAAAHAPRGRVPLAAGVAPVPC
jgi:hypothetical protein